MAYVYCLLLIVCGALAASALIIKKKPDAAELLAKLVPVQGILGTVLGLWSLLQFVQLLINFGAVTTMFSAGFKLALLGLATIGTIVTGIVLGFLLAYGLLEKYVLSKNVGAAEKAASTKAKLIAIQIPLGLAGIGFGLLFIILVIIA